MSVAEAVATAMRQYPTIHPCRAYCLVRWLLDGTSYMKWHDGELVNECAETDEEVAARRERQRVRREEDDARPREPDPGLEAAMAKIFAEIEAEQAGKTQAQLDEMAAERRASLDAWNAQHARAELPEAWVWRTFTRIHLTPADQPRGYLDLRAPVECIPDDVTADWLAAIREVLHLAFDRSAWVEEEYPNSLTPDANDPAKKAAKTAAFQAICRKWLDDIDARFGPSVGKEAPCP